MKTNLDLLRELGLATFKRIKPYAELISSGSVLVEIAKWLWEGRSFVSRIPGLLLGLNWILAMQVLFTAGAFWIFVVLITGFIVGPLGLLALLLLAVSYWVSLLIHWEPAFRIGAALCLLVYLGAILWQLDDLDKRAAAKPWGTSIDRMGDSLIILGLLAGAAAGFVTTPADVSNVIGHDTVAFLRFFGWVLMVVLPFSLFRSWMERRKLGSSKQMVRVR